MKMSDIEKKAKKEKKAKRPKITYIDDGRTIADMSSVSGSRRPQKIDSNGKVSSTRPPSTLKDQWQTYIGAVKMMFVPMLVVLGIITLAFLIMYFLL